MSLIDATAVTKLLRDITVSVPLFFRPVLHLTALLWNSCQRAISNSFHSIYTILSVGSLHRIFLSLCLIKHFLSISCHILSFLCVHAFSREVTAKCEDLTSCMFRFWNAEIVCSITACHMYFIPSKSSMVLCFLHPLFWHICSFLFRGNGIPFFTSPWRICLYPSFRLPALLSECPSLWHWI